VASWHSTGGHFSGCAVVVVIGFCVGVIVTFCVGLVVVVVVTSQPAFSGQSHNCKSLLKWRPLGQSKSINWPPWQK